MLRIALKNLLHDKTQFAVAVVGVSFSVILMAGQIGVFLDFMENSALMIDNIDADIWITSRNSRNFDFSQPLPERKLNLALRVKGVASGEKLIFGWTTIRNPDGGSESVGLLAKDLSEERRAAIQPASEPPRPSMAPRAGNELKAPTTHAKVPLSRQVQ